jgi:hypothetical protein
MHSAGAACCNATTKLGASEIQMLSYHPKQGGFRLNFKLGGFAIDGERNGTHEEIL